MITPIPRFANQFFQKYPDRILYGTDMPYSQRMFSGTFRILESNDEHFYLATSVSVPDEDHFYEQPIYGLGVPDDVLKKVYRDNALNVFNKAQNNAA